MAPKARGRPRVSKAAAAEALRGVAGAAQRPRPLYEVLGISEGASQSDVQKAFKLRALKVHPDKNPGDEGAKAAFQELQRAYEVLRDPERRRRYDASGEDGDGESLADEVVSWFRAHYRPVTIEEIVEFTKNYRESAEERADIAAFVRDKKGDVSHLLECIACSEPSDVGRFSQLVDEMLKSGEVPGSLRPEVERTLPKLRKNAAALLRRNARERRELERNGAAIGAWDFLPDAPATPLGGRSTTLQALAEEIRGRQQARWASSITAQLEAKYGGGAPPAPLRRPAAAPSGAEAAPAKRRRRGAE